jgi:3D (Asp-Asp-Asp) domain-containing protein
MHVRDVMHDQGASRLRRAARLTPFVVLAIVAVLVGEWACAPRATSASDTPSTATSAFAAMAPAALQAGGTPPQPAQVAAEAPPSRANTLNELNPRLDAVVRPVVSEDSIRRREQAAAAVAFPVAGTLSLSSTMYCLKGEMRTGVRTRDGMAAGDPRVLPLGSVVRVRWPDGDPIGIFVIMDTGGAIRGNDIDLYVDSCAEARRWGRHQVVAEILDIGKRN